MLVAVYGTLKAGEVNYRLFLEGEEPVFRSFVKLPFAMYANDEYPMLVPTDGESLIHVEVFDVDEVKLAELDSLELPYGYWRERVRLHEMGEDVEIYLHPAPVPEGFVRVASGEWRG
jgi:gamma-glutamylcyclotransferase (GGCT)/AIG2-like uncharacterized protein YtfP